jgi:glutaredoxin
VGWPPEIDDDEGLMNRFLIVAGLVLISATSLAQSTLYKVVDPYGNVTYQDRPPEGDARYEERAIPEDSRLPDPQAPVSDQERIAAATQSHPLVLFTVPRCDSCDFVRWFLDEHTLPYEEVNVESDIESQQRLKEATGEYRVPVLMVGDQPLFGYDRENLLAELQGAGYLAEPSVGNTPAEQAQNPVSAE